MTAEDESAAVRTVAQAAAPESETVRAVLLEHLAPSVRLVPDAPAASRSRFGGAPLLPAGTEWPRRASGRPLAFLLQLDLRELPRTPQTELLPPAGVLAVFYDLEGQPWGIEPEDGDGVAVVHVPPGPELVPLDPPADLPEEGVRPAAGVRFALDATADAFELPIAEDDRYELAERLTDDHPQHRLLGEPQGLQGDPRGYLEPFTDPATWRLLVQLDSGPPLGVLFGDVGRLYVLIRDADLRAHRWDRVWPAVHC